MDECLLKNEMFGAFVLRKSLSQVVALLLDGWLQALLPNPKVPECVKSESPLVFPRIAIRYHQPFKKGTKSIVREKNHHLFCHRVRLRPKTAPLFPANASNSGMRGRSTKFSPFSTSASFTVL